MDHSDEKVKGIDRYLPSLRAKVLAFLIIPSIISAYAFVSPEVAEKLSSWLPLHQFLLNIALSLGVGFFVTLALVLELVVVCYQSKHSRTYHYTYHAPEMNFKWLYANAGLKEYGFLLIIFIVGVACGHYL